MDPRTSRPKDREGVNVGTNEAACGGMPFQPGHFYFSIFLGAPPEAFGSHRSSAGKVEKLQGQGRWTGEPWSLSEVTGGIPHKWRNGRAFGAPKMWQTNNWSLAGSTIRYHKTWEINPKDWQVLSLGDAGFLPFFLRVVSSDYGKPRLVNFFSSKKFKKDRIYFSCLT